jgi:ABC-type sulfate/molybdate transport systems ATPase subunit
VILSAEGICKSYGGEPVLRDCSLAVRAGECLLLRGPSGAGKSTLLRILALVEPADSGTVLHGARRFDATRVHPDPPYPFLTVVFQQLFLWPNLTMAQNLSIVLTHRPNAALPKPAMEMLERLSIAQLLHQHPHECSLGQRQRMALARAFLSDAEFLLLDEPSSALDRTNRGILVQELKTAASRGRGILLITHDDGGFEQIASRSLELENGQLHEL